MDREGLLFSAKTTPDQTSASLIGKIDLGSIGFGDDVKILVSPSGALTDCNFSSASIRQGDMRSFSIPCQIAVKDRDITVSLSDKSGSRETIIPKLLPKQPQLCSLRTDNRINFEVRDDSSGWTQWGGKAYQMDGSTDCKVPPRIVVGLDIESSMQRSHPSDFMRCDIGVRYSGSACTLSTNNENWLQRLHTQEDNFSDSGTMVF
ncbi:MAG: hypothetical protein AAF412_09635, partial [Pseudomonadota bacterium]